MLKMNAVRTMNKVRGELEFGRLTANRLKVRDEDSICEITR
jgi:hypothetical protein